MADGVPHAYAGYAMPLGYANTVTAVVLLAVLGFSVFGRRVRAEGGDDEA